MNCGLFLMKQSVAEELPPGHGNKKDKKENFPL